jgi:hypothetical protein
VESTRSQYIKKWLLHLPSTPTVYRNGRKSMVRKGIQSISKTGPYEVEHQRGRLTVWPLLPEARKVRAVGGPGYEAWIDQSGKNFPPDNQGKESEKWRLEVSPSKPSLRNVFLTVLHTDLRKRKSIAKAISFDLIMKKENLELTIYSKSNRIAHVAFRTEGPIEAAAEYQKEFFKHSAPAPKRVPIAK